MCKHRHVSPSVLQSSSSYYYFHSCCCANTLIRSILLYGIIHLFYNSRSQFIIEAKKQEVKVGLLSILHSIIDQGTGFTNKKHFRKHGRQAGLCSAVFLIQEHLPKNGVTHIVYSSTEIPI